MKSEFIDKSQLHNGRESLLDLNSKPHPKKPLFRTNLTNNDFRSATKTKTKIIIR